MRCIDGVCSNFCAFLLVASIAQLVGAVCVDETCAASLQNSVQGKASMLQQNAIRAAPVDSHQPQGADVPAASAEEEDAYAVAKKAIDAIRVKPSTEGLPMDQNKYPPTSYVDTAVIDRKNKIIMGWAPRSASAATCNMFFLGAGMYTAADQAAYPWVHDYRESLGDSIKPQGKDMSNEQFFKFKVVRNPYARAVSSWVHQTSTGFSYDPRIRGIAAANGVDTSVSFLDWLKFVKKVGWMTLDAHSYPQFSFWEYSGGRFEVILQLEDPMFDIRLDQINLLYNTSFKFETMHVSLEQSYNRSSPRPSPHAFQLSKRKDADDYEHATPEELYTQYPEAIQLVEELYQEDFNVYGYQRDVTTSFY